MEMIRIFPFQKHRKNCFISECSIYLKGVKEGEGRLNDGCGMDICHLEYGLDK